MSELYGAPSGIIASDQNIRQNIQAGLQAQKTLGEIEQLPADLALKQSHARLYGAEAALKEEEASTQALLGKIQTGMRLAQGKGVEPTVADLSKLTRPTASSAEPIEALVREAWAQGVPVKAIVPLSDKAATIRQHEASTLSAQTQADENREKTQSLQRKRIGAIAGTAALSLDNYRIVLGDPEQVKFLPPGLTGNWAIDQPVLKAVESMSLDADKKAELEFKRREADARDKRVTAEGSKATAYVNLSKQKLENAKQTYEFRKKYDGSNSAAARDAQDSMAERRDALTDAQNKRAYPPLPLDAAARRPEKVYTTVDGRRVIWQKKTDGSMGLFEIPMPPKAKRRGSSTDDMPPDEGEE